VTVDIHVHALQMQLFWLYNRDFVIVRSVNMEIAVLLGPWAKCLSRHISGCDWQLHHGEAEFSRLY
jgi:hypothetical protein